jgi:hypothetical protein
MRIKFWASALLVVTVAVNAPAQKSVALASGKMLTAAVVNGRTVFTIPRPIAGTSRLRVRRDANVAADKAPSSLRLVAEIPDGGMIVVDTYPSIPGGMSYCQAGEESFLRVIAFVHQHPVETYRTKLESCRENAELASPGLQWSADTNTLEIHWLSAPGTGKPEDRALKIGANGKAVVSR